MIISYIWEIQQLRNCFKRIHIMSYKYCEKDLWDYVISRFALCRNSTHFQLCKQMICSNGKAINKKKYLNIITLGNEKYRLPIFGFYFFNFYFLITPVKKTNIFSTKYFLISTKSLWSTILYSKYTHNYRIVVVKMYIVLHTPTPTQKQKPYKYPNSCTHPHSQTLTSQVN